MSHTFGGVDIPIPNPLSESAISDPALDVLAEAIPAILASYCGSAWEAVAPGIPLIRSVFKHDPKPEEFREASLPALYIYRETVDPNYDTDDQEASDSEIRLLWVEPPATQDKRALRAPFYNGFAKAIGTIVQHDRDPSWMRDGDTSDEGEAYGSSIPVAAGFDLWFLPKKGGVSKVPVVVDMTDGKSRQYVGFLVRLMVKESSTTDLVAYGASPTRLDVQINTGGDDPLDTPQHIRDPATP